MDSNDLARLHESKAKYEREQNESGFKAGVEWAKQHAEWADLLALSKVDGVVDAAALKLGFIEARYDEADFAGTPFDGAEPSDEFAAGFHEGVMTVFDTVADAHFV